MKIFHIADIHLGEFPGPGTGVMNARMLKITQAMSFIVDKAELEEPDLILIAGDLFHKSKVWADTMLVQVSIVRNWLKRLREVTPDIIVLFGTGNHDNIKAFELLKDLEINIVTEPKNIFFNINNQSVTVSCVPGIDKRVFRSKITAKDTTDENVIISNMLGDIVSGLALVAAPSDYKILLAHYSVVGASMGNGQHIFNTTDITLNTNTIDAAEFNLACLGHIHEPQRLMNLSTSTFYSGSIHRVSFTEENQRKGFYIHETLEHGLSSEYVDVPAYEMQTISLNQEDVLKFINSGEISISDNIENRIIKVLYECDSEIDKRFNKKSLEEFLYSHHAFYVQEIRPEKITQQASEKLLTEQDGVIENITNFLNEQTLPESITSENIIDIAAPIVAEIEASINKNKSRGLFVPLSLEVNNYRKYKHQEFDFTKIDFAMVTGQNGAGKSSFFMDGVIDCLFEEPREGDLTGWISSDIDVRSGNIRFKFKIGEKVYEVARSRTKSGKAGLSIFQIGKGITEDISELKKEDTQKKIVDILGMDSKTFKVCVMIMQDNYGLFLEASKDERMKILSRILGLEVYEKLEKKFDEKRAECGRNVKYLMGNVEKIDSELISSSSVDESINISKLSIIDSEKAIVEYKSEIATIESAWNNLKLVRDMKDKAETRLFAYKNKRVDLQRASDDYSMYGENHMRILARKDYYAERAAELEKITKESEQKKELDLKRFELENSLTKLNSSLTRAINDFDVKTTRITMMKNRLSNKNDLILKSKGADLLIEKQNQYNKLSKDHSDIIEVGNSIKLNLNIAKIGFDNTKAQLSNKIQTLNNKISILDNSNCIDAENAKCRFLEDAIKAKEELPGVKTELEKVIEKYDSDLNEITLILTENDKKLFENEEQMKAYDIVVIEREIREKNKAAEDLKLLEKDEELLKVELEIIEKLEVEKTELYEQKQKVNDELGPIMNQLNNFKFYDYNYMNELIADTRIHSNMNVTEEQYKNNCENKVKVDAELVDVDKQIDEQECEIRDINTKLSSTDFESLKVKIQAHNSELKRLEDLKNQENIKLGGFLKIQENRKILKENRIELIGQIEESNRKKEIFAILKAATSMDGVPFMIVKSILEILTSTANDILAEMTGGKMRIEMITEKTLKSNKDKEVNALEVLISNPFSPELGAIPYLSRSGGEKVKAALAVAFALSELNAKRAGVQLGMMFVDEPPFLDEDGVQAYTDALEALANKFSNMSVLAISHDPAMQSRFAQTIEVINTSEGSKVVFNG